MEFSRWGGGGGGEGYSKARIYKGKCEAKLELIVFGTMQCRFICVSLSEVKDLFHVGLTNLLIRQYIVRLSAVLP